MKRWHLAGVVTAAVLGGAVLGFCCLCNGTNKKGADTAPASNTAPVAENKRPLFEGEWLTYHGDSALRGVASCALPEQLAVLWRMKAGGPVRQTPVVHAGLTFVATARGEVIAADAAGERVWSHELFTGEQQQGKPARERIEAAPSCFHGRVLIGTMRGVLYSFDAESGKEHWQCQIDSPIMGAAAGLTRDGKDWIYVIGRANASLHCIDAETGQVAWRGAAIDRCDASPSVSPEAVVYGSCAAAVHVFSPMAGNLMRQIDIGEESQVAGGVALDGGALISGSRSGKIIQADIQTGAVAWINTDNDTEVFTTPAVTVDMAVAGCSDGNVLAISRADGKTQWRFDTEGTPTSAVIADGKVVVAADGELFLLRLADGAKLWSMKLGDEITSPAVVDGLVLVGSEDGTVVALGAAPQTKRESTTQ